MTLVYPQFPRLADIAGGTIDAFNQSFGQSRDRRNEREAGPLFDQAFGQYLAPQQGGLGALAPQQPLQQPQQPTQGQQPQNAVQRSPLPGTPGYADHRVNQAHGGLSGNQIFSEFMGTVRQGGVTNPYALAAIASTGKRESGFSPGNAFRTWSDPSESGQAGTAGGIMSWRAERLQNLQRFAQQRGEDPSRPSPRTQAEFLLAENPALIQQLQNAGSVQEAQRMMDNAWKFAGYNRPGGEAAARLQAAQGFLPQFQGEGGAQQALEGMAVGQSMPMGGQAQQGGMQPQQMAQMGGGMPQGGQMPMPDRDTMRQLFANPVTRPLAIQLAQAAMGQHDPMRQLQMQKAMLELQQMQDPRQNLINAGGGQLYDPNSGQWISAPGAGESDVDEFGFPRSGAISQKIRGLVMQGIDPQTAMGIATGRYNVSINPATGERVMIDQAEQQVVPLRQPDYGEPSAEQMGQPQQPQRAAQSRQLWDMTDDATGVWAGTRSASSNTLGQLPGALGETFTSDAAVEAGQEFDLFKRDLVRSLSLNPRFPVAEMQRIENLVPRGAFTAPNTLRKALTALNTELIRIEREMTQALQDPRTPVDQRQADMQTLRGVRAAIERIGMPSVTESTDIDDLLELYGD